MFYDLQIKQISSTTFFHLYNKMVSGSFSKRTELQGPKSGEQVVVGGDQYLLFWALKLHTRWHEHPPSEHFSKSPFITSVKVGSLSQQSLSLSGHDARFLCKNLIATSISET